MTAAHDATGSDDNGHHLYLASWYYGAGSTQNRYGRITIAESTGNAVGHGHVMLVAPTGDAVNGNFVPISNIHADGIVWYGNKLFVATDGTWFCMARECPTSRVSDPTATGASSCIHRARPKDAPSVVTRSPSLTQNLTYSFASGRLRGLDEYTVHRVVFTVDPP
ncbi:hypothetical protein [Streptomyces sp. NPDC056061]|uniref:hypothetical protein n=1 Tax=Streptomyces sp. NPDC056061 TaxID=3345700 RepID=UPI0035DD85E4